MEQGKTEQDQRVTDGSSAIQSGRDTIIQQGITAAQMREILEALAAQITSYAATAKETVDSRLAHFEREILGKFANRGQANPEAFKDPDFQYLINRCQHSYARSGDRAVLDVLVGLIGERSRCQERTRLPLTLNGAVEKAAVLTANEFAELSLCFSLKYTASNQIRTQEELGQFIESTVSPLLPDISRDQSSYLYIESQGCGSLGLGSESIPQIFRRHYPGLLSGGFDREMLESRLPDGKKHAFDDTNLIIKCFNDPTKLQIGTLSKSVFLDQAVAQNVDLTTSELRHVWGMFEGTLWGDSEFVENVRKIIPDVELLVDLWENTPLRHLRLTALGIAIGHANLTRTSGFDADLKIWIK